MPTVNTIRQVSVVKMRTGFLLVILFLLMKLRCSHSRCEETGSRSSTSDVGVFVRRHPNNYGSVRHLRGNICFIFHSRFQQTVGLDSVKRNILKRYNDLDYDSFVGLMGRRNASEISLLLFSIRSFIDTYINKTPQTCICIISVARPQCFIRCV